jgi:hypothetical protein
VYSAEIQPIRNPAFLIGLFLYPEDGRDVSPKLPLTCICDPHSGSYEELYLQGYIGVYSVEIQPVRNPAFLIGLFFYPEDASNVSPIPQLTSN